MEDIKKFIEETVKNTSLIKSDEIPNIDLYMDQVTTFLTSHLSDDNDDKDPVFTKTMINNYAKSQLLPSPEKKKYTKDHMLMLINIYYLKNVMSINNIHKLLSPISEKYFHGKDELVLTDIYDEIYNSIETTKTSISQDMEDKLKLATESFKNASKKEKDYLQLYSYISLLSFDVYMKKQLIDALINTIDEKTEQDNLLGFFINLICL